MPFRTSVSRVILLMAAAGLLNAVPGRAGVVVWRPVGPSTNDWFVGTNWSGGAAPSAGDDVVITNVGARVLLTNSTPYLGSLSIGNASFIFSNWDTTLSGTQVAIRGGATLTMPPAFATNQMSNCIVVQCVDMAIDAGGKVDADGRGYAGATASGSAGQGPGRGRYSAIGGGYGGGGAYGGRGADVMPAGTPVFVGGVPYGDVAAPGAPGSGGGQAYAGPAGAGGGAVRITAAGTLTVNGTITASGAAGVAPGGGGGSGGSVHIVCGTLAGTNGVVVASGGAGTTYGTGGGGGRIAVSGAPSEPKPSVRFAAVGAAGVGANLGDLGTLYLQDAALLNPAHVPHGGQLIVPGWTRWEADSLTFTGGWLRLPTEGFALSTTGDLTVIGSGTRLELGGNDFVATGSNYLSGWTGGPSVNVGGNLLVAGGAAVHVFSAATNAGGPDYGAWIGVTGLLAVAAGSALIPYADSANGGAPLFSVGRLAVDAGGRINADSRGYGGAWFAATNGLGPGGGRLAGGGGYGGSGGNGSVAGYAGGLAHGTAAAPVDPGSGGGSAYGTMMAGAGGGLVRIESAGAVTVNGSISANGGAVRPGMDTGSGGGSGGGVHIRCGVFAGTNGAIAAGGGAGGDVYGGGGGGGRIAIVATNAEAQDACPKPGVRLLAGRGTGFGAGDMGTVYVSDSRLLDEGWMPHTGQIMAPELAAGWSPGRLVVTGGWIRFPQPGYRLSVTNSVLVAFAGRLDLVTGSVLDCGGDLVVSNGGSLHVYGDVVTNAAGFGAMVSVTGTLRVASNAFVYSYSHPTNGGPIVLRAGRLEVAASGAISSDGRGYAGGGGAGIGGVGPGAGAGATGGYGSGGGHGGRGGSGSRTGGPAVGSATNPAHSGSGGGGGGGVSTPGGAGGGAIVFDVTDDVVINGTLTANGAAGGSSYGGGGAGGAIRISCRTVAGTGGVVRVAGGAAGATNPGAGGGGRIALCYDPEAQRPLPVPRILLSAAAGTGGTVYSPPGDVGSIWLPDTQFLTDTITGIVGQVWGITAWSPNSLTVTGVWIRFPEDGFVLAVTNAVRVSGPGARLELGGNMLQGNQIRYLVNTEVAGPTMTAGGDLLLENGGSLSVYAGLTNGISPEWGALVRVGGRMSVGVGSWVYPYSHGTNGGSPLFRVQSLAVQSNGGFNADAKGFQAAGAERGFRGNGPGSGYSSQPTGYGGGAGYGGTGGRSSTIAGQGAVYGASNAPVYPGSAGGGGSYPPGANGGGLVRIEAEGSVDIDGTITANGETPAWWSRSDTDGGGSGGGIYIRCRAFGGRATGVLRANGGDGGGAGPGAGGGGRIAVWRLAAHHSYAGAYSVTNGIGYSAGAPGTAAQPGTVVLADVPPLRGATLIVR